MKVSPRAPRPAHRGGGCTYHLPPLFAQLLFALAASLAVAAAASVKPAAPTEYVPPNVAPTSVVRNARGGLTSTYELVSFAAKHRAPPLRGGEQDGDAHALSHAAAATSTAPSMRRRQRGKASCALF